MENTLGLKKINDLRGLNFYIPSYQRGYRWGIKEVTDLLNDIDSFTPFPISNTSEKTWYCLQPIVVKKRVLNNYEVIDGQQRLTTIYLVLHFFNQILAKDYREKIFSLEYETRDRVTEFFQNLNQDIINNENADFYYISQAYKTVCSWFSKGNFDRNDFQSKFEFNSRVIWYEVEENEPISIFTRINIGKIPLTNSELIKALFLNSSNFNIASDDKIRLRQLEIASEWENIENTLQDNDFWYFICNKKKTSNRIEFIFDLMNENKDEKDSYSTFRYFSDRFSNQTEDIIFIIWDEVKDYFRRFIEWYNERELYHKIGYLVCAGEEIENIVKKSKGMKKSDFSLYLDSRIREKIKKINLEELQYGEKAVKSILLLYNVQTMLNNKHDKSKFPFSIFANSNWDIEHITSVKDMMPQTNRQRENWIGDALEYLEDDSDSQEIKTKLVKYRNNELEFSRLYEDIINYFNRDVADEEINDISNLTLLDSTTNRGYKNAVFPVKRATIIRREKEGTYIPLCTKNIFLKYISEYPPKMSFWTQEDRDNYYNDLTRVLSIYLSNNIQEATDE